MRTIDHMKVNQARNSFFNPDTGNLLPSLDVLNATTGSFATAVSPHSVVDITQREIVTAAETKGVCERSIPGKQKSS